MHEEVVPAVDILEGDVDEKDGAQYQSIDGSFFVGGAVLFHRQEEERHDTEDEVIDDKSLRERRDGRGRTHRYEHGEQARRRPEIENPVQAFAAEDEIDDQKQGGEPTHEEGEVHPAVEQGEDVADGLGVQKRQQKDEKDLPLVSLDEILLPKEEKDRQEERSHIDRIDDIGVRKIETDHARASLLLS